MRKYIRNPRCGNLLGEVIVDQMMFAGRRAGARSVYPYGLRKMIFRLSLLFKIFADFGTNGYPIP